MTQQITVEGMCSDLLYPTYKHLSHMNNLNLGFNINWLCSYHLLNLIFCTVCSNPSLAFSSVHLACFSPLGFFPFIYSFFSILMCQLPTKECKSWYLWIELVLTHHTAFSKISMLLEFSLEQNTRSHLTREKRDHYPLKRERIYVNFIVAIWESDGMSIRLPPILNF